MTIAHQASSRSCALLVSTGRSLLVALSLAALGCGGVAANRRGDNARASLCESLCDRALGRNAISIAGDDGSCTCMSQDGAGGDQSRLMSARIEPVAMRPVEYLTVRR